MARPTLTFLVAAGLIAGFTTAAQAQVSNFQPITDAELLDPDPADWINWRRTIDGQGYSPLDQIDRDNVGNLQLVWSWETLAGTDEVTPLVHDGVMYIPSRSGVVALDATTGDPLWTHLRTGRPMPSDPDQPINQQPGLARRNIAIYDDKIYAGTSEAQLIALDARTGEMVWEHQVADHDLGYQYTSGPIVVKGMVVAGMTGCEYYKNDVCFISAHDAQTGAELWRTSTVARPGEPGGDTWGDLTLTFRAGADAWIPGSYDADADLIYWSTAQPPKPWASAQRAPRGRRSTATRRWRSIPRPVKSRGTSSTFRPRRTTSTRCSSWLSSTGATGARCTRWARSASCGSSIPRPANISPPTISDSRTSSTSIRRADRVYCAGNAFPNSTSRSTIAPDLAGSRTCGRWLTTRRPTRSTFR